jgi:AAA domain
VVVISLTRSNPRHDIGFMFSPERLNVLISRARESLIIIGNADTFMNARKGADLWKRFLSLLKDGNHIYDGFPVRCERHKDRITLLKSPTDFDTECPDGGCKEPWYVIHNTKFHELTASKVANCSIVEAIRVHSVVICSLIIPR